MPLFILFTLIQFLEINKYISAIKWGVCLNICLKIRLNVILSCLHSYDGAVSALVFYCGGLLGAVNHQQTDHPHVWRDARISIGQYTLSGALCSREKSSIRERKTKTPSFIVSLGTQLIMPETKLISNANLLGKQSMGEWGKRTSCPHFQAHLEEHRDPIKAPDTRWKRN